MESCFPLFFFGEMFRLLSKNKKKTECHTNKETEYIPVSRIICILNTNPKFQKILSAVSYTTVINPLHTANKNQIFLITRKINFPNKSNNFSRQKSI